MNESLVTSQWTVGLDVIVTDPASECYGLVGRIVRISARGLITRLSVEVNGDVYGFEQDDLDIVTL